MTDRVDDIDGKFTACIAGTISKFTIGVSDTGGHTFHHEIYNDRGDTGSKFAADVNDTSGQQWQTLFYCLDLILEDDTWITKRQESRDTVPLIDVCAGPDLKIFEEYPKFSEQKILLWYLEL